ncbi:MAG: undecaprenyl-diphosphatase UppP [Candidatus Kapabacteria bacterium]|nr:undecaprenyl-diphosphatase UppP [Candidatus Kapabacteria bacterium]
MSIIEAIILGIIQGLTEFIPISSTAHLTLAGNLMGLIDPNQPEHWTAFIAVIQLGTLAAVLVYFFKDILGISNDFLVQNFSKNRRSFGVQSTEAKLGWYIIIGTIPIVVIGLAGKKIIEGNFTKDPLVIAIALITLAIILAIAEKTSKFNRELKDIKFKDAILIGLAQSVALIPGSSRSGTTITAGLFLGLKRETAARFSFLLSIPAIFASGIYEFYKSITFIDTHQIIAIIIATVSAGISGYLSIAFLLNYLKKRTTYLFIWYRIGLGILILIMLYARIF